SDRATIKVLTKSGYEVAQQGDNGSVCMVMRGFSAPTYSPVQFRNLVYDATVLAPICFTPAAVRTAMPYYELRTKLALQGKRPDEIAAGVEAAYAKGELPNSVFRSVAHGACFENRGSVMNSLNDNQYIEDPGPFEARYLAFLETISTLRPSLHRYCARMTG